MTSLPQAFLDFCLSHEVLRDLPEALTGTAPEVSVRVNSAKGVAPPAGAELVPWNQTGFYLNDRPRFTFDPALHQGLYYVQDASSMAIGHVIRKLTAGRGPIVYADVCAAPGGKTTAAIDTLPEGSLVVANEYDSKRAAALCENIERWGSPNVMVRRGDTSAFASLPPMFDIIAADVPCSGEGMMRKEADAVTQWSPGLIRQCAALQREIVGNLWPALKPGGYLIYSTCTFNTAEDEENVRFIMEEFGAEPVATGLTDFPGVVSALDSNVEAARFIPGRVRGEGLFIAVLRKPNGTEHIQATMASNQRRKGKSKAAPKPFDKALMAKAQSWIKDGDVLEAVGDDRLRALPAQWADIIHSLEERLGGIIFAGTDVATIKGRDLIPAHTLALSSALQPVFPTAELDYNQAIAFLRREPLVLPDSPRGLILLTYRNRPLGFVKNLGNRANTLLPPNRRILSPTLPDTPVQIL